jgi:hypothetical protein
VIADCFSFAVSFIHVNYCEIFFVLVDAVWNLLGHSENASSVSSWAENAQRVTPYPWAVCEVDRAGKWALHKLSTIIKNNFVPR